MTPATHDNDSESDIAMGNRDLNCADAVIRNAFTSAGLVECDSLDIAGTVVDLGMGARDVGC